MPRNASGTYTLPAGNPVVSGNIIEASWANGTMSDLATEMTNSLSRSGAGGMTGAFRAADGSASVPGIAFGSETTTGWYRAGTNDVRFVIATNELQKWTANGTAITGTMSVSGDVGIGTSSPGNPLDVTKTGIQIGSTTAYSVARFRDATPNKGVSLGYDSGSQTGIVLAQTAGASSNLAFWTFESGGSGWAERMRLDASGNLGIGTISPAQKLDVRGAENGVHARFGSISNRGLEISTQVVSGTTDAGSVLNARGAAAGTLIFQTDSTERARITSGGDLLVGTTTLAGTGGLTLQSITDGYAIVNNNNAAGTGYVFQSFRRSSVEVGSITQNGTTAVLYNTTSDRRLKDNIVPAPSASNAIDAIQIVSYDWKAAPDEHVTYGVIAQDLHAVAPQAVLQGDDGDEIEKTWGVDYSKLVPMLIKEIQTLRARVAALEA
jgi:hypothetical protein